MSIRPSNLSRLTSGYVAIVVCAVCVPAFAQVETTSGSQWLSGKKLLDSNRLPVSVSWTESPIRSQLNAFAKQQRRAIYVDRRVDPTIKLTFQFLDQTTEQVVWRTAEANGLGVARIGDLLYVGPKESAARLPFVIAETVKNIPKGDKSIRRKWHSKRSSIQWQRATTSQEIQQWFEQNFEFSFDAKVPHDVWSEVDWPSLSLTEQMSLLLVGFDLSFTIDANGKSIRLREFPALELVTRKIRLNRESKLDIDAAKREFETLKIAKSGKTVSLKGSAESIADFEAWMVMQSNAKVRATDRRTFNLVDTTGKRREILEAVAQQTGRKFVLLGNASEQLTQRITISIEKASLETLVEKCLEGTELRFKLSKSQLTISGN